MMFCENQNFWTLMWKSSRILHAIISKVTTQEENVIFHLNAQYHQTLYQCNLGCNSVLATYSHTVQAYIHIQGHTCSSIRTHTWQTSHRSDYGGKCFSFWIVWESRNHIPLTFLIQSRLYLTSRNFKTTAISPSGVEFTGCSGTVSGSG